MTKLIGIYCIENIVNGKKYIGKSVDIKDRFYSHKNRLRRGKHGNCYLQKSWDKYGESNFNFSFIQLFLEVDLEILDCMEIYWIIYFQTHIGKYGYNLTMGGGGMVNPSEETRKKLSIAGKGRIKTVEEREKLSKSNKGRITSDETKKKLSIINTGKKYSEETRKKHSNANVNRDKDFAEKLNDIFSRKTQGVKRLGTTSSRFVGVTKSTGRDMFTTKICYKGDKLCLGQFKYEIEAALAYNEAALEIFGSSANLNNITPEEIQWLWDQE